MRLIDDQNNQLGVLSLDAALRIANEKGLDLVEVAPQANPPVSRLMDYGRYKFETVKREKDQRRKQNVIKLKEMKLRPKVAEHDFQTKFKGLKQFLEAGEKVKVTIMFRGREQSRPELGFRLLQRLASDVEELGFVESQPKQDGRNMIMVIGPHRKKSETKAHTAGQGQNRPVPSPRAAAAAASRPAASEPAADGAAVSGPA